MLAHKVSPYVQGSKNDINDSISKADDRPGIRAVAVKTVEQQYLMLYSLRQQAVQQRNALRAHLSEHGIESVYP